MKKTTVFEKFEQAKIMKSAQKKIKGGGKVNWGLVIVIG